MEILCIESENKKFSYPAEVWVKILDYLFSDTSSREPKFGNRRKPAAVKNIAELIFSQQIVQKQQFQSFPNLSHTFESDENLAKKTTPSSAKFGLEVAKHVQANKRKVIVSSPAKKKQFLLQLNWGLREQLAST